MQDGLLGLEHAGQPPSKTTTIPLRLGARSNVGMTAFTGCFPARGLPGLEQGMGMREVRVVAIGVDQRSGSPVLLLREAAAQKRVLPVWVGLAEATAIELERRHIPAPRPLTHQLICQVIDACGRRLERVSVTSLHEGTFHAELLIGPDVRVSARVSDAVAMALHQGVPIHAADVVLDQAAMADIQMIDNGLDEDGDPAGPVDDTELERMRRFLDDANPEDFDIS
jgi:uncharacterized protein